MIGVLVFFSFLLFLVIATDESCSAKKNSIVDSVPNEVPLTLHL